MSSCTTNPIDGNSVCSPGGSRECHGARFLTVLITMRACIIVVRCDSGQRRHRGAGVDRQKGIEGASLGCEGYRTVFGSYPRRPNRTPTSITCMGGLTRLFSSAQCRALHSNLWSIQSVGCREIVILR